MAAAVEHVELMDRLGRELQGLDQVDQRAEHDRVNRLLSQRIDNPLHLGITEAGTKWSGSLKSAVGLGTLLADGIGDTIRISLSTFHAEEEVKVAWEILKALELRERGPVPDRVPHLRSAPVRHGHGRGRDRGAPARLLRPDRGRRPWLRGKRDRRGLACRLRHYGRQERGPDLRPRQAAAKVPQDDLVDALFHEIDKSIDRGAVLVDERESAEGAAWLSKIEEENAGELTPERIAAMEAPRPARACSGTAIRCRWPVARSRSGSRWTRTLRRRPRPLHARVGGPERPAARTKLAPRDAALPPYFLPTVKEAPADAEAVSHQLIVRGARAPAERRSLDLPAGRLAVHRKVERLILRGARRDRGGRC